MTDNPKALHLITRLDPGGSAENTLLSCRGLAENGWHMILASGPGWTADIADSGGPEIPVVEIPSLCRDPSPIADLRAFLQIYRLLRRERPQILHTHSAKAGILGRWAGWLARTPHIVHTPHGHVLYGYARGLANRMYLLAERVTAPITQTLVALSAGEMTESAGAGIGRLDKWVVIHSGVDVEGVVPRDPAAAGGTLRVGVVARLEHVKGIDVLVQAAGLLAGDERFADPGSFEIHVWGDGRQHQELLDLAQASGAGARMRFVGTTQPVEDFLRTLDVYTQPSRNEGMGRALVLAQATGLPVVASNVCGIPDVVRDGETGLLVQPDDPGALAEGLASLLRDGAARKEFGAAARSWIMSTDETGFPRFSIEAMLCRLQRLNNELVGNVEPAPAASPDPPASGTGG